MNTFFARFPKQNLFDMRNKIFITSISKVYLNAQQIYKSFYGCLIRAQMYQKDMAVIYLWQRH